MIGLYLIILGSMVFWFPPLPGPPSQYEARFPIAQEPLPQSAMMHPDSLKVGFDLYTNPKAPPAVTKYDTLPLTNTTTWLNSSQQDGRVYVRETFWIEHDQRLYQVANYEKIFNTEPNQYLNMKKVLSIDTSRQMTERVIIPEIEVDKTFGPFQLP